ncbi:hypothetical protein Tco_0622056 [Tanacetum coccineum]
MILLGVEEADVGEEYNNNCWKRDEFGFEDVQKWAETEISCLERERVASVATNARQSKGKLHGIFLTTSFTSQDVQTFTSTILQNLDQLEKQFDKEELQEDRPKAAFWVINKQFQMFIDSQFTWDYDSQMTEKYFAKYTGIEVKQFRETLLQHMGNVKKSVAERTRHKRHYDNMMNERQMQSKEGNVDSSKALDASLVVTKCSVIESKNSNSEHAFNKSVNESSGIESRKQDTSSSSENYITHAVDADIRPANDHVPFVEVQLNAQHNVLANEQKHTEQSEPIYDTYLLKKVDSNTTPDSTNMSHKGGQIDQDAEQYQVKIPLLNAEFFKTKDMVEKEVYNELSNRFLQLEKYCICWD